MKKTDFERDKPTSFILEVKVMVMEDESFFFLLFFIISIEYEVSLSDKSGGLTIEK